jgi:hypothetical protein
MTESQGQRRGWTSVRQLFQEAGVHPIDHSRRRSVKRPTLSGEWGVRLAVVVTLFVAVAVFAVPSLFGWPNRVVISFGSNQQDDLPLYKAEFGKIAPFPSARPTGDILSTARRSSRTTAYGATYSAHAEPDQVRNYYDKSVTADGWESHEKYSFNGFLFWPSGQHWTYCRRGTEADLITYDEDPDRSEETFSFVLQRYSSTCR